MQKCKIVTNFEESSLKFKLYQINFIIAGLTYFSTTNLSPETSLAVCCIQKQQKCRISFTNEKRLWKYVQRAKWNLARGHINIYKETNLFNRAQLPLCVTGETRQAKSGLPGVAGRKSIFDQVGWKSFLENTRRHIKGDTVKK